MAKKRNRPKYTSKGERPNTTASTLQLASANVAPADKWMNKAIAWKKSQNPWITVEIRAETLDQKGKMYKKVRANAIWGDPKNRKNAEPVLEDA